MSCEKKLLKLRLRIILEKLMLILSKNVTFSGSVNRQISNNNHHFVSVISQTNMSRKTYFMSTLYIQSKVLQYFDNISAALDTFAPEIMKVKNYEIPSLLYTLRALLAGIASLAWSTATESTALGLPHLAWLLRFSQPKWNFWNHLVTVLWSTTLLPFRQQMFWLLLWRYS